MRATLRVVPTLKDQEVVSREAGHLSAYWEGSGRITGTWKGSRVSGASYTELTGFAGKFIS